jgi:hypothetical protein
MTIESSVIESTGYKYFDPFRIEGRVTTFPYNVTAEKAILKIETQNQPKRTIVLEYHLTLQSQVMDSIKRAVTPLLRKIMPFLRNTRAVYRERFSSAFRNGDSVITSIVIVITMAPLILSTYFFLLLKQQDKQHLNNSSTLEENRGEVSEEEETEMNDDDEPVDFFDYDTDDEQDERNSVTFDETLPPDSPPSTAIVPRISHESIAESLLDLRNGRVKYVVLECPVTSL